MQHNLSALNGIEFEYVNACYNLQLGFEFCSAAEKKFNVHNTAYAGVPFPPVTMSDVRAAMDDEWRKLYKKYRPIYDNFCKWHRFDFVIIGLQALNIPIIRSILPNVPIIYYPGMFTLEWENAYIDSNDEKLVYVMHDEEMLGMEFPCKYQTFIHNSLNPAIYGPYTGEINKVLTVFHNLDTLMTTEILLDHTKEPKTPENSYPKIVDGIPHQLYGATNTPEWMGARWINTHDVVQEMKKHRCGLIYSRIFSALATAQMLASGVPSVGFVASDNELHKIIKHGESGFISRNIAETREILQHLLADYDYARKIGEAGRAAYYQRHNWSTWLSEWSNLIHSIC